MVENYKRVLIKKGDFYFKFINLCFDNFDGSLYITLERSGENNSYFSFKTNINDLSFKEIKEIHGKRKKWKKISYHGTGRIHFENISNPTIFSEPLLNISRPFTFFSYSIPTLEKLDIYYESVNKDTIVVDGSNLEIGRLTFSFLVAPVGISSEGSLVSLNYSFSSDCSFSISIHLNGYNLVYPKDMENHFIFPPMKGLFNKQVLPKEVSVIRFNQAIHREKGAILLPPNGAGIYTLIYTVPMRIRPEVTISYPDPSLKIIEVSKTTYYLKFKVNNRYGHTLKETIVPKSIFLNAEL